MFGILKSLFRIFRAKGTSAVEALEADHIEVLANQAIVDAKEGFESIKNDYAKVLAELERNRTQLNNHQKEVRKWNAAAEKAMADGDENLARNCLERAISEEESVAALSKTVGTLDSRVGELKTHVQQYKSRIGDAEREKRVLLARKRVAESTQRVQETMNKVSTSANAFSVMERLKNQVEDAEAQVAAEKQLSGDVGDLEDKMREISKSADITERMESLRQKLKQTGVQEQTETAT